MVIAIIVVVTSVTIPLYSRWQISKTVASERMEIAQHIRLAQTRAESGKNNSSHGVYFLSTEYILYEGTAFTNRDPNQDQTFNLPANYLMSGLSDVVFEKKTGVPNIGGTITVVDTTTGETTTITINSIGLID